MNRKTASLLAWLAAAVAGDCGDGPTVVVPAVKKGLSNQRMRIVQDVAMAQLLGYAPGATEHVFLYRDMTPRELLQRRATDADGNTVRAGQSGSIAQQTTPTWSGRKPQRGPLPRPPSLV